MQYEILYADIVQRQLKKLPLSVSEKIVKKIKLLSNDLYGDVKKLSDYSPEYRLRVGDHRILFDLEGNKIIIQAVRNRQEGY
jgi:mRNA interferase RelE/StbE